jgi:hypothetical protein
VTIELLSASRCVFHNHMHLDRTNIVSKNIVKMLTHSHMTRSLGGVSTFANAVEFERKRGFGVLSPSRRACKVGFRRFQGVETTFFHYVGSQKRNRGEWRSQK